MRIIRIALNVIIVVLIGLIGYTYYSMTTIEFNWVGQTNLIVWFILLTLNFLLLRFNYDRKTKNYLPGILFFLVSSIGATSLFLFPGKLFDLWNYVALTTLIFATFTLWRISSITMRSTLTKLGFLIAPSLLVLCLLLKWIPNYFGIIMITPLILTSGISLVSLFNKGSKTV